MDPRPAPVPSKDYARQYRAMMPALLRELERVLLEEEPILGASVDAFEAEFARWLGAAHGVGVGSGTDALLLALRAAGIGAGDEVITAANTFLGTVTAIVLAGASPVLVDPDPRTLNVEAEGLRRAITPRTRALMPVHLYGRLCPMESIAQLAAARGLALIEDAAQAHGARDARGRAAGTFGSAGCFSFHPSKNLGAFGDGGFVATSDAAIAEAVRRLRHLGKVSKYEVTTAAPNTKLDTIQAALLRLKLPALKAANVRRRELALRYRAALDGAGDLVLPDDPGDASHCWHLYVVRTERRDELRAWLKARGITSTVHYPVPPHRQDFGIAWGYGPGDFPVAERLARTVLSLPISPELEDDAIDRVAEAVHDFYAG